MTHRPVCRWLDLQAQLPVHPGLVLPAIFFLQAFLCPILYRIDQIQAEVLAHSDHRILKFKIMTWIVRFQAQTEMEHASNAFTDFFTVQMQENAYK